MLEFAQHGTSNKLGLLCGYHVHVLSLTSKDGRKTLVHDLNNTRSISILFPLEKCFSFSTIFKNLILNFVLSLEILKLDIPKYYIIQ